MAFGLCAFASLFGGCVYDDDDRCGEHQVLEGDACVCTPEDTTELVGNQCIPCEANEVTFDGVCDCEEGYIRSGAGVCIVDEFAGLGEACESDDDCPPNGANVCATDDLGSYCTTSGCEAASDCPLPYGCETEAEEPHCVRAPSGLDEECTSQDECGDFEANYCETMIENKCKVRCGDDPGVCHGDWACCDYSALIGAALCVSSSDLADGACPFGGELLEAE